MSLRPPNSDQLCLAHLTKLWIFNPRPFTSLEDKDELIAGMVEEVRDFHPETVQAACAEWKRSATTWPATGEFLKLCREHDSLRPKLAAPGAVRDTVKLDAALNDALGQLGNAWLRYFNTIEVGARRRLFGELAIWWVEEREIPELRREHGKLERGSEERRKAINTVEAWLNWRTGHSLCSLLDAEIKRDREWREKRGLPPLYGTGLGAVLEKWQARAPKQEDQRQAAE